MKKIKRNFIYVLFAVLISGCSMQRDESNDSEPAVAGIESEGLSMDKRPLWEMKPDEVAPEQFPLYKKTVDIFWNKLRYNDKGMELIVDEAYILKEGLPAEFYDFLQEYVKKTNEFMEESRKDKDEDPVPEFAKGFERGKAYFYEYLDEFEKTGISMDDYQNRQIQELLEARAKREY